MPRAVCCGAGALDRLPEILRAAGVKKAAVFTDPGIRGAGLLDPVLEQAQEAWRLILKAKLGYGETLAKARLARFNLAEATP